MIQNQKEVPAIPRAVTKYGDYSMIPMQMKLDEDGAKEIREQLRDFMKKDILTYAKDRVSFIVWGHRTETLSQFLTISATCCSFAAVYFDKFALSFAAGLIGVLATVSTASARYQLNEAKERASTVNKLIKSYGIDSEAENAAAEAAALAASNKSSYERKEECSEKLTQSILHILEGIDVSIDEKLQLQRDILTSIMQIVENFHEKQEIPDEKIEKPFVVVNSRDSIETDNDEESHHLSVNYFQDKDTFKPSPVSVDNMALVEAQETIRKLQEKVRSNAERTACLEKEIDDRASVINILESKLKKSASASVINTSNINDKKDNNNLKTVNEGVKKIVTITTNS